MPVVRNHRADAPRAEALAVARYELYLESGPQRKRTLVHVPQLLGCTANGPTTDAALGATPDAIRAFLRFLARHGDRAAAAGTVTVTVVQHFAESGSFMGQGSPYLTLPGDLEPLGKREATTLTARFAWMCEELAAWVETRPARQLEAAPPERGRTARAILLHAISTPGAYLSAGLGGAPGFSRVWRVAEEGRLPLQDALRETAALTEQRLAASTEAERSGVRSLSGGARQYSARKSLRRTLEHTWEHLAELARRPGGPPL